MSRGANVVASQFNSLEQQNEAANTGMWVFLASELLFFGALFFGYTVTRLHFSTAFAEASKHTDIVLGTVNTAVLLTSSLTMALGVEAAKSRNIAQSRGWLLTTLLLGFCFLIVKLTEYHADYVHQLIPGADFAFNSAAKTGAQLFFYLYFAMTGIHALHMVIGLGFIAILVVRRRKDGEKDHVSKMVPMAGLYWHLIDIVWIFLFPLLYLVSRT